MSANFEDAFARVKELAAEFKANENFYLSPQYQEAEARRDFIDKFLIALGWDVNHETQKNPYEQEVKVESKEPGVSQRRADYAFYLAPNFRDVKFYVEAKKPHGDIATTDNYFQTIRYGWNSRTPIAALCNFGQFEIVDCRFKPDLDTVLQRNLKKFHYGQYSNEEVFAEIYWLFSREAVAGGSLEKYAETLPKKRGAVRRGVLKGGDQSFDEAFLEELDAHRDALAHIFKNGNPTLDGETLTEITQRTLDRLVFIRFLEDKLIEPQYLVARFGERGSAWGDFIATSRRLDGIYNGIVFKENAVLDKKVKVDDGQFAGICKALCHINSPYDFNAIPIHILGSIYERFLGKVIVATDKRARVEEKPEVRKAGGVYYTPEYIVRYIVENTVGQLIEGKTPAQIAAMRFADIACGSGSFLLGVYDLLIRYHTKFYNDNPGKAKKGDMVEREDGWHLTLQKRREILLNNIYGVDIDTQAVEVAQLSLYLKLLQDETPASARGYQMEFHETLLPSLSKNIVCGNSLIGRDVVLADFFENGDTEKKLNPMNFEDAFPHIFRRKTSSGELRETPASPMDWTMPGVPLHGSFSYKKLKKEKTVPSPALPTFEFEGGFDAIVGNPPYGATFDEVSKDYLNRKYVHQSYQLDSYLLFLERTVGELIAPNGYFGMIIPNPWLTNLMQDKMRRFITNNSRVKEIVHFRFPVFPKVTVDTEIVILQKARPKNHKVKISVIEALDNSRTISQAGKLHTLIHEQAKWQRLNGAVINIFLNPNEEALAAKLVNQSERLESFCEINVGIKPYQVGKGEPRQSKMTVETRPFDSDRKETKLHRQYLRGSDINRYLIAPIERRFLKYGPWLAEPRPAANFNATIKIFMRQTGDSLIGSLDEHQLLCLNNMHVLVPISGNPSPFFLLGIINSKLLNWFYQTLNPEVGEALAEVKRTNVARLPIHNAVDKARHDKLVSLVEQMLAAKPQLAGAQSDKDKDFYENKCAALDRQIDALVYELYNLTADEIKIVEGAAK